MLLRTVSGLSMALLLVFGMVGAAVSGTFG